MLYSAVSGIPVYPSDKLDTDISSTICITGHREKSIPAYKDNPLFRDITLAAVKLMLYRYIDMAVSCGYVNFISGLAVGTDLWAAEYILQKRCTNKSIRLIGAMPYLRHAERYPSHYLRILKNVEKEADLLITVNDNPDIIYGAPSDGDNRSKTLYRERNYFMVDRSSAVVAFLSESSSWSGTAQTVNYAIQKERKIGRFGIEDVFAVMDIAGTDTIRIGREIAFIENAFRNNQSE